ncbi:MAG: type I-E CRISPR-associated protein Cse2/CasB [Planctomycetota bacterium]
MTATEQYIGVLTHLKAGELGLLRSHAGQALDQSVQGFDLFTGLWWPLRQKSPWAPRREVAWLIAKVYAFRPIEHSPGHPLASQLCRTATKKDTDKAKRLRQKFDEMLLLPLGAIEPALQWALDTLASNDLELDWVKLTDDLSMWERESTRLKWAKQFLGAK